MVTMLVYTVYMSCKELIISLKFLWHVIIFVAWWKWVHSIPLFLLFQV